MNLPMQIFRTALRGSLLHARAPAAGDWVELSRRFDASTVRAFAEVTGDANPIHVNADALNPFGECVVHGALVASLIPACFSACFPGAIYRSQTLKFLEPVPVGSLIRARIVVTRARALDTRRDGRGSRTLLKCSTTCELPSDVRAVTGDAEVLLPDYRPEDRPSQEQR